MRISSPFLPSRKLAISLAKDIDSRSHLALFVLVDAYIILDSVLPQRGLCKLALTGSAHSGKGEPGQW